MIPSAASNTFILINGWEVRGGVNLVIKQEFSTMELMGLLSRKLNLIIRLDIVWFDLNMYVSALVYTSIMCSASEVGVVIVATSIFLNKKLPPWV